MFSFLRGRLRTSDLDKAGSVKFVFSFLRGRLRTKKETMKETAAPGFHSFEVGFGRNEVPAHMCAGVVFIPSR